MSFKTTKNFGMYVFHIYSISLEYHTTKTLISIVFDLDSFHGITHTKTYKCQNTKFKSSF